MPPDMLLGHETTSGMLSFATYYLMKNPEAMRKAQQEVDIVVGKAPVALQHMSKFPYLEAVLREALRLEPTAPAITLKPIPGTTEPVLIGGGKYLIPPGASILAILPVIGRDPAAFGPDAAEFKPERMYKEAFDKLPLNAWKVSHIMSNLQKDAPLSPAIW
jgi:cytochrome P450 / NADPH-cytochrome P450 reductase